MAWHQQSPTGSSDSSALSGQGTPDVSDGEGNEDRGHGHKNGSENHHDEDEMYELEAFSSGGFSNEAGNDENDGNGRNRTGGGGGGGGERRLSGSTVASFQLYTPDEERAVVRKFDRRLVVFLAFCYMLSFVDRSSTSASCIPSFLLLRQRKTCNNGLSLIDIGNARIAGMEADLQSTPPREDYFEWALRAFYITYIAFEWMSLLWRLVPAHIYVSLIVLSWGIIASLQAVVTSYPLLIALRALLGIGEAGFAGAPFYLSFFFKRRELAFRTALFISGMSLLTSSSDPPLLPPHSVTYIYIYIYVIYIPSNVDTQLRRSRPPSPAS